jgi:dTDP-glucose pyrophosphorylase
MIAVELITYGPVVIHNCDTLLLNRKESLLALNKTMIESDGYVDVFHSNNHQYSYVLATNGMVTHIAEKVLISDLATSGLYGFASAEVFKHYYRGQSYISDMYSDMIKDGKHVSIGPTFSEADTIVVGTPDEYIARSNERIRF